jgi:hypothetical protein
MSLFPPDKEQGVILSSDTKQLWCQRPSYGQQRAILGIQGGNEIFRKEIGRPNVVWMLNLGEYAAWLSKIRQFDFLV